MMMALRLLLLVAALVLSIVAGGLWTWDRFVARIAWLPDLVRNLSTLQALAVVVVPWLIAALVRNIERAYAAAGRFFRLLRVQRVVLQFLRDSEAENGGYLRLIMEDVGLYPEQVLEEVCGGPDAVNAMLSDFGGSRRAGSTLCVPQVTTAESYHALRRAVIHHCVARLSHGGGRVQSVLVPVTDHAGRMITNRILEIELAVLDVLARPDAVTLFATMRDTNSQREDLKRLIFVARWLKDRNSWGDLEQGLPGFPCTIRDLPVARTRSEPDMEAVERAINSSPRVLIRAELMKALRDATAHHGGDNRCFPIVVHPDFLIAVEHDAAALFDLERPSRL